MSEVNDIQVDEAAVETLITKIVLKENDAIHRGISDYDMVNWIQKKIEDEVDWKEGESKCNLHQ